MKRLAATCAALVLALAAIPLFPSVGQADTANPLDGVIAAEIEAFAVRVEYDIPLPVSPGTLAHVTGEVRRSQAGENAKGLSAAPTHFDAVVAGTYADPNKDVKGDERNLPQTECFFPGHLIDTRFAFPTETQAQTEDLPPIAVATARCAAGPEVELRATNADVGNAADAAETAVRIESVESNGLARPVRGALEATTATHAGGLSFLGGALKIADVKVSGRSRITGRAGEAMTSSSVALQDINAGGVTFSIADDKLVIAGQTIPIDAPAAQVVFDTVNAGLVATGCRIAAAADPGRYPQGFLFSRPEPRVGADPAGGFAASYRAGLFILCDIPESITSNAQVGDNVFSPQRMQAVIGFVYTSTSATAEIGGFGLGDLLAGAAPSDLASGGGLNASVAPVIPDLSATGGAIAGPAASSGPVARRARTAGFIRFGPMDATTRWILGLVSFAAWLVLTHLGLRRLRGVLS